MSRFGGRGMDRIKQWVMVGLVVSGLLCMAGALSFGLYASKELSPFDQLNVPDRDIPSYRVEERVDRPGEEVPFLKAKLSTQAQSEMDLKKVAADYMDRNKAGYAYIRVQVMAGEKRRRGTFVQSGRAADLLGLERTHQYPAVTYDRR
ncbi:hypothetical protein [Salinithrix halophila]|uniref:Sporulation related protein n=1 Tax=Salinithrix halophila TaxID=1485204 RepID=A0ABV8JFF4_9BACL